MPTDDHSSDSTDDPIDALGRAAGAELRRPAPAGGLAGIRRSHRRRRTATAAGAVAALVVVAGGTILLTNRGDGEAVVTEEPTIPFDPSIEMSDLGGTWWLTEIDGEVIESDPTREQAPWVVIGDDELSGYFGCNWVGARVPNLELTNGRLVALADQTLRGCSEESTAWTERVLSELILASPRVRVGRNLMVWSGDNHVATFARSVDDRLPSPFASSTTIADTDTDTDTDPTGTWWLTEIDGEPLKIGVDAVLQPWVTIDGELMNGFLGCNSFNASDVTVLDRWLVARVFLAEETGCVGPSGTVEVMPSERVLIELLDAVPAWTIVDDTMTWSEGERTVTFIRSEDGSVPTTTTMPTSAISTTTTSPTSTLAPTATTVLEQDVAVSDEVLPDPNMFGADGFERELIDRNIVVRSNPEVVIPIDVPDEQLRLIGIGPENVAYIETTTGPDAASFFGPNRVLAIPTTGPNSGVVSELFGLQEIEGAWASTMGPMGIDHLDLPDDVVALPFVDSDGQALSGEDPTLTWFVDFEILPEKPFDELVTVSERSNGRSFDAPLLAVQSEGNRPRALRPLPDGRVVVAFGARDDSSEIGVGSVALALDPATGLWTQHPIG